MRNRRVIAAALGGAVFLAVAAAALAVGPWDAPFYGEEQLKAIGRYEGPSPFELGPVDAERGPVLTADDIDDVDAAYVTDPFVVRDGSEWFMFLGVRKHSDGLGAIGVATGSDGVSWEYEGLVIEEPFHTSYPHVVRDGDRYYLVPETSDSGAVRLYRAERFPTQWVLDSILLEGEFTDPTPFEHDGRWWMFVGTDRVENDSLALYTADELTGPWVEHPDSPVVDGDANVARPGGRVLRVDDRLYRITQDDSPRYGNGVWAFEIVELSAEAYRERRVGPGQVLEAGDEAWNNLGLGHLDAVQTGPDSWIGYVSGDGRSVGFGFDR